MRIAALVLTVVVVVLWAAFLRPGFLGGPAGYTIVSGTSMSPTLESGDLVVTQRQSAYSAGDVIVYTVPQGEAGAGAHVIHRVVGGDARTGLVVRGDNLVVVDPCHPTADDVVGKVEVTIPQAGDTLLLIRTPLGAALLAGLTTLVVALALIGSAPDARPRELR
jgi:signal peptidase